MNYPEVLTFTAEYLSENPANIRMTDTYKNIKKKIWEAHCNCFRYYECHNFHPLDQVKIKVLKAIEQEGFIVKFKDKINYGTESKFRIEW